MPGLTRELNVSRNYDGDGYPQRVSVRREVMELLKQDVIEDVGLYNMMLGDYHEGPLRGKTFRRCNLTYIRFPQMEDCTFEECYLYSSTIRYAALNILFMGSTLNSVIFEGKDAPGLTFLSCYLDSSRFMTIEAQRMLMEDSLIHGGYLYYAQFSHATFSRTTLDHMNIIGTNFTENKWKDVTVSGREINDCDFSGSSLIDVSLLNCQAVGCRFDRVTTLRSDLGRRERMVKCKGCGDTFPISRSQSGLARIFCHSCIEQGSYNTPNSKIVGKECKQLPTFSIEFEVAGVPDTTDTTPNPLILLKYGFIRCRDGSVEDEYKSPIYQDARAFSHVLPVFDTLAHFVTDHCGTHIHIGFTHKGRLNHHFDQLFDPMVEEMEYNADATSQFWGRFFNNYAQARCTDDRYNWLNVRTGKPTIEFRLPVFVNSKQYGAVVHFTRELGAYLDRELEFYRTPKDYRRMSQRILDMYHKAHVLVLA